ncbi:MAG: hypothetical protein J6336_14045 [Kiritimatiellae bacterium]|nr:hypothetical protein [Kiritimatiellia bacterium]
MNRTHSLISAPLRALTAALLATLSASAFLPPVAEQNDISLRIENFDEASPENPKDRSLRVRKVDVSQPFSFTIAVANNRKEPAEGILKVWMNDDWTVSETEEAVSLNPGEKKTFTRTATPSDRILNALYPIHAELVLPRTGDQGTALHPIALFEATHAPARPAAKRTDHTLKKGVTRLDADVAGEIFCELKAGETRSLGHAFSVNDNESGSHFQLQTVTAAGIAKRAFSAHPPWRNDNAGGTVFADFPLTLPAGLPCRLTFSTALLGRADWEPPSDGTEYIVSVTDSTGDRKVCFSRFSAKTEWEPASVDLSAYAGQRIILRLATGPGPQKNTTCDRCAWGDPILTIGECPPLQTETEWQSLEVTARARAASAVMEGNNPEQGQFQLTVQGKRYGAAVITGRQGITDGVIAFSDGNETLTYRGFACSVDFAKIGGVEAGLPVNRTDRSIADGKLTLTHYLNTPSRDDEIPLRLRIWPESCALRMAWDMPGVERDLRGTPRYTELKIGPASLPVWRAYAGFGNVFENPKRLSLGAGGFSLSTRHIGGDYTNGLSLVQATDIFPDRLECTAETRCFALCAQHDTTFSFVPSANGAFDAARAFRSISGYRKSPGIDTLIGRMCLDQWGGAYDQAAEELKLAADYGVKDAVFVKHVWQRWGYDYRLPEIFPPLGCMEEFLAMRQAAKRAGILFCPHDNYIDFYPDAEDYSYDHIIFNPDGTPQKAWYNEGRHALSYRWMPHAFQPWMTANMKRMKKGFSPDSLFIDVFSAIAPMDYYDRTGQFHTRVRTAREWSDAFDTCRNILKSGAPMISEAGTDALIGSLDAGQADHFSADRWADPKSYDAAERTPWHDIVTHGKMILFAGGLGPRYAAIDWGNGGNQNLHGYGSDDYLNNTVIGGRAPMCNGPFSRRTVMTYWLLHDLCAELAKAEFESHTFGETIHQQHTTFSNGAEIWSNRGSNEVTVAEGKRLPQYGFYAKTPDIEAGILLVDSQRAAFARSQDRIFVDARPPHSEDSRKRIASAAIDGAYLGDGHFEISAEWTILTPVTGYVPFVHIIPAGHSDQIVFQGNSAINAEALAKQGLFRDTFTIRFPKHLPAGTYEIRYGLYDPKNGPRLGIIGINDDSSRISGGYLTVAKDGETFTTGSWKKPVDSFAEELELNTDRRMLTFDAIATDGAFLLEHGRNGLMRRISGFYRTWILTPLPGSLPFRADISLEAFGAKGGSVYAVEPIDPISGKEAAEPEWSQAGDCLSISCDAGARHYRIRID